MDSIEALYVFEAAVIRQGMASYCEVIASAKVPIVKLGKLINNINNQIKS
jgi:hypothetical protein